MKLPAVKKRNKCKAFHVLPTVKMPKNQTTLKLFTKTWPLKKENNTKKDKPPNNNNDRPLTATLEKPTILDINFIDKLDMSLVRKEFLNITTICRMPLIIKNHKRLIKSVQPVKLKKKINCNNNNTNNNNNNSEDSCMEDSLSAKSTKKLQKKSPNGDNNNNKIKKQRKHLTSSVPNNETPIKQLPEPCKTCGRPDQPERFHSHPTVSLKSQKKNEEPIKIPVKNTVQKPVAMKYKSKKPSPIIQKLPNDTQSSTNLTKIQLKTLPVRVKSAKRTLTCYICGKEFGTASLPLHEPKCLEKWERENANLPTNLQRKPPIKPDTSLSHEEFNKQAWEASQSTLTPCLNCGRTFYPDRLLVHQRSCKLKQQQIQPPNNNNSNTNNNNNNGVSCYVCGRNFGTNSIKIHEKQCIKKWYMENDALPEDMKSPPPQKYEDRPPSTIANQKRPALFPCYICGKLFTNHSLQIHERQCMKMWKMENDKLPLQKRRQTPIKPDIKFTDDGRIDFVATNDANWQSHLNQLIPCKLCGRTFYPDRVEVHERNCKG